MLPKTALGRSIAWLAWRPGVGPASAPRREEGKERENAVVQRASRSRPQPRFRRSDGVWQDQDSNLGRRKPAILQCARPFSFGSPPVPTWPRPSAVSCANNLPVSPAVTPRPRPFRRVPRGMASGGAKVERNSAAVRPNSPPEWRQTWGSGRGSNEPSAYRSHRLSGAGVFMSGTEHEFSSPRGGNSSDTDRERQQAAPGVPGLFLVIRLRDYLPGRWLHRVTT
jgi:hypothetical protein